MADLGADYRLILMFEFKKRKAKNARYSLRAFARLLALDAGFLSKINSGQLILSVDLAGKIASRLKLDKDQRACFIQSAAEEQKCHALYLLDESLTECDPSLEATNRKPFRRRKK